MSATEVGFEEYLGTLRARVNDQAIEAATDTDDVGVVAFKEEVLTGVVLAILEDLGQLADTQTCYFDRRLGRGIGKINAWGMDEENGQVTLVTTIFRGLGAPSSITRTDLVQAIKRARRVFLEARLGRFSGMEPASEAYDMMQRLYEVRDKVDRVRILVIGDGHAADLGKLDASAEGLEVQTEIWDLRRLFRADSSGLPYESIEIDFAQRLGQPLPCIASPKSGADFDVYLAVLPGSLLHQLYHEFGARLLELNVRSFLQARGKVNRGIRNTLEDDPSAFIAYNNGISATAEWVETTNGESGLALTRLRGLQIVNGGQTVASIHRAKDRDKLDLSSVYVQAKLTVVQPKQVETLVPLISRYANTQNRVNEADFSANHPFHVNLQKLALTVWVPGEQSRWFYERARGQYEVAQQREGITQAQVRRFKQANPPQQRFDKISLAKYVNAWGQLPHIVSRGGQKSFVEFMQRVNKEHGARWEPDAAYYRRAVAQAIIFKHAERLARQHKFSGYRANAIAYTVALVSYRTAGRVDLDQIWNEQELSQALADTLDRWMPDVHAAFVESAAGRNVTEWCKKEECWRHLQTLDHEVSQDLEEQLAEGQVLPELARSGGQKPNLSPQDRENIARVMQVPAEDWVYISGRGARSGSLQPWQCGIATTLASYAAGGWTKIPSHKQANQGVKILAQAEREGWRA
jgi:AIPR protein/Abortive infection phage resistance protein N-terminal domain